jgi:hypothetical protein
VLVNLHVGLFIVIARTPDVLATVTVLSRLFAKAACTVRN